MKSFFLILLSQLCLISPRFNHYTVENGLSFDTVTDIVQDHKGYLWIATENGLNRYDGYSFKTFYHDPQDSLSLGSNYIHELHVDRFGTLWIKARNGGLIQYSGNDHFFSYVNDPADSTSIASNTIVYIFEDSNGDLWLPLFQNEKTCGLDRFDQLSKKFIHCLKSSEEIYHIFEDNNKQIWITTGSKLGHYQPNSNQFQYYTLPDYLDPNKNIQLTTLQQKTQDVFWVGSSNQLLTFDTKDKTFSSGQPIADQYPVCKDKLILPKLVDNQGALWCHVLHTGIVRIYNHSIDFFSHIKKGQFHIPDYNRIDFFQDHQGTVWIALANNGLLQYLPHQNKFSHHTHHSNDPFSLNHNGIFCLYEDYLNNLWIGTLGGGLNQLSNSQNRFEWLHPFQFQGEKKRITAMAENQNGQVWLALADSGLFLFDLKTQKIIEQRLSASQQYSEFAKILSLYMDNENNLWVGTKSSGLIRFNTQTNHLTKYLPPNLFPQKSHYAQINDICKTSDGKLWCANRTRGIYIFDLEKEKFNIFSPNLKKAGALPAGVFTVQKDEKDRIWAGTDNGVCFYNSNKKQFQSPPQYNQKNLINHRAPTVFAIEESYDGSLWIGTFHSGLHHYFTESDSCIIYRREDGLLSDMIRAIKEDRDGRLWIATDKGLCVFNPEKKDFTNFLPEDGMPRPIDSIILQNNQLLWNTEEGLVLFHPQTIQRDTIAPEVHITGMTLFNQPYAFNPHQPVRLKHNQNFFGFHFTGIQFNNSKQIQYAYKMKGMHDKWIQIGKQRSVTFSGVAPGKYQFQVSAANKDGAWKTCEQSIDVIVAPPFWRTRLFNIFILIMILSTGYLIYYFRLRHFKKIEEIRLRIASDLHDEIGSNLGSITFMSQELSEKISEVKNKSMLQNIQDTATKTADAMRDIVWFIQPENDNAEKIRNRMIYFTHQIFHADEIQIQITPHLFQDNLPLTTKRNIYLIFKECLHNIKKHAEASQVIFQIKETQNEIHMTIKDNGRGFEPNAIYDGTGMHSIKKRTRQMNGQLSIQSNKGMGTQIDLTVPIKQAKE